MTTENMDSSTLKFGGKAPEVPPEQVPLSYESDLRFRLFGLCRMIQRFWLPKDRMDLVEQAGFAVGVRLAEAKLSNAETCYLLAIMLSAILKEVEIVLSAPPAPEKKPEEGLPE